MATTDTFRKIHNLEQMPEPLRDFIVEFDSGFTNYPVEILVRDDDDFISSKQLSRFSTLTEMTIRNRLKKMESLVEPVKAMRPGGTRPGLYWKLTEIVAYGYEVLKAGGSDFADLVATETDMPEEPEEAIPTLDYANRQIEKWESIIKLLKRREDLQKLIASAERELDGITKQIREKQSEPRAVAALPTADSETSDPWEGILPQNEEDYDEL